MRCPHSRCRRELHHHDAICPLEAKLPRRGPHDLGAFTVCWECGELAIFVRVLGAASLRCPNPDESAALEASSVVKAFRRAMRDHPYSPHIALEAFRLAQGN